jgi:hypothetical protein
MVDRGHQIDVEIITEGFNTSKVGKMGTIILLEYHTRLFIPFTISLTAMGLVDSTRLS